MSSGVLDPPGKRWVGRVLRDRWRIDVRIANGGMGVVFAATHMNNGSRVAIKVLHPAFSGDPDVRSRFLQEGYAANQVNHPGVVRILDDDVDDGGNAYLVMELLEGELLEQRRIRKGGTLPMFDVYEVGEQLLDVLAAAHAKGIVHRDIKPDNLFITLDGRLKVLDFGFAQMRSKFRSEPTVTGFLLGTPGFMSPEQALGNRGEVDAQTDIWAAGATLFTLVSGESVHVAESAPTMLVAAANASARSLCTVASFADPRLIALVDRALAFDKRDRWPSARAMQVALREISGARGAGSVSRTSLPSALWAARDDESEEEPARAEGAKGGAWRTDEEDPTLPRVPSMVDADESDFAPDTEPTPSLSDSPDGGGTLPPAYALPSAETDNGPQHTDGGTLIIHRREPGSKDAAVQSQGQEPRPPSRSLRPTDPRGMDPEGLRYLTVSGPADATATAGRRRSRSSRTRGILGFFLVAVALGLSGALWWTFRNG